MNETKEIYVVTCSYYEEWKHITKTFIMKDEKSAKRKVEELHTKLCDRLLYGDDHTTYEEHEELQVTIARNDQMVLSIDVEKRELCFLNDEIISFMACP